MSVCFVPVATTISLSKSCGYNPTVQAHLRCCERGALIMLQFVALRQFYRMVGWCISAFWRWFQVLGSYGSEMV